MASAPGSLRVSGQTGSDTRSHCSALLVANALFGAGSVIGSIGLPSMNPLLFAALRETSAMLILACVAWHVERRQPKVDVEGDGPSGGGEEPPRPPYLYFILGLCVFLDQGCSIAGIKLSDAVTQRGGRRPSLESRAGGR